MWTAIAMLIWFVSMFLTLAFGLGLGSRLLAQRMLNYAREQDAEFESGLRRWYRYNEETRHGRK